jgi:hypothetical protein
LAFALVALSSTAATNKRQVDVSQADNCNLKYTGASFTIRGSARNAVKLRTANDGAAYTFIHDGHPLTVAEWLRITCQFHPSVLSITNKPIAGIETQKVALEGFLVAARFENAGDHDIHAELADTPAWSSPHVVVEVPPGPEYCAARKTLWSLVKDSVPPGSNTAIPDHPRKVKVTGYVFLDAAHGSTHFCTADGGRGIRKDGKSSVQGLWEIHPVLEVAPAD